MNLSKIIIAYGSLFVLGITANVRGPLFPDVLMDLKISDVYGSLFFSITSITGAIGSLVSSIFLPEKSLLTRLQLALIILTIGLIGTGFVGSYSFLLLFSAMYGLASGMVGVWQNILVKQGATAQYLRQTLSGLHSMYAISSLFAPLVVSYCLAHQWSWRPVFILISAIPLLLIIITIKLNNPETPFTTGQHHTTALPITKQYTHIWFGSIIAACSACEVMISTWLSLYLQRNGSSSITASLYVGLFFACLLCGRALFTFVNIPWDDQKTLWNSALTSAIAIILGLWVHPLFLAMTGLLFAPFFPVAMNFAINKFTVTADKAIAWAVAIMSVMIVLTHSVIGYLSDVYGMQTALHFGLCLMLFVLISLRGITKLFA